LTLRVSPAISTVPPIVKAERVPTEVKEEAVTVAFKVFPLNVPAAAVTVMSAVPSKLTPLIALAVAKAVAVAASPAPAKEVVILVIPVTLGVKYVPFTASYLSEAEDPEATCCIIASTTEEALPEVTVSTTETVASFPSLELEKYKVTVVALVYSVCDKESVGKVTISVAVFIKRKFLMIHKYTKKKKTP